MTARLRAGALAAALSTTLPLLLSSPASAVTTTPELAYVLDRDGDGLGAVVLRDLTARTVRTLVPEGDDFYADPVLSPDGTRIAVATDRGSATGEVGIAVLDVVGGGFQRLTSPGQGSDGLEVEDASPTWQPEDGSLVFARNSYPANGAVRGQVLSVPAAGGTPVQVAGTSSSATSPDVSADGRDLAFVDLTASRDGGSSGDVVVLRGYRGASPVRTVVSFNGADPAISPSGTEIAFTTAYDGVPVVLGSRGTDAPATQGGGTLLYAAPDDSAALIAPFWLPDGRSVAFSRLDLTTQTSTFDLWAVDRSGLRAGPFLATSADEVFGSVARRTPEVVVPGTASTYVPVEPVRVLDTRPGTATGVAAPAKVGPGGTVRVQVAGAATSQGAVPADVSAVVLNVTVTRVTTGTDVRVFPSGSAVPEVSNLNAAAGQTVPNLVTVAVGADGAVVLRNGAGSVDLIADLAGYYVPGDRGAGFALLLPFRVLDTRPGSTVYQSGPVLPGATVLVKVTGTRNNPPYGTATVPDTATAVILNVTGTGATRSTDLRVYPWRGVDGAVPEVSNLNLTPGLTAANLVVVPIGLNGEVAIRNAAGSTHVIADVAGYFGADGTARLVPAGPARFLDTRDGTGAAPVTTGPGGLVDLAVAGRRGVPEGAVAAVLNLTVTGASASTDVRAYPSTVSPAPVVSNLNVARGVTRANAAVVKTGSDGQVRLRNGNGSVHLIADLAGWFVAGP